jgi:hypothetical protein
MKRMKKKVVAMVTLAMFVMTLLPMAAFATVTNVDLDNSEFQTVEKNVSVEVNEAVPVSLAVKDAQGNPTDENNGVVYAWLEDANGNVVYDVKYFQDEQGTETIPAANLAVLDNGYAFKAPGNGSILKSLKVNKAGTYTLKAGFLLGNTGSGTNDRKDLTPITVESNHDTIEVTTNDVVKFEFNQGNVNKEITEENENTEVKLNPVKDNGRDSKKFTLVAKDKTGAKIVNKELSVKSNSSNLVVTGDTITDNAGKVELTYKAKTTGKFTITVKADKLTAKFTANGEDNEAKTPDTITTVVNDKVVSLDDAKANNFEDAVQLEVFDQDGNKMDAADAERNPEWKKEPIYTGTDADDYSTIVEKPAKSTLKDGDFVLQVKKDADENDVFTIKLRNGVDPSKIKVGTYTVNLALFSGDSTDVTFEVKEAGDPVELKIKGDDTVKAGEMYTAKLYKVDANGIETQVEQSDLGTDLSVGYNAVNGSAVAKFLPFGKVENTASYEKDDNEFGFISKTEDNYYGVKVTLFAIDSDNGLKVTKDVTIVDPAADDKVTYEFDNTKGEINKDNTVKMTLKDEYNNVKDVTTKDVYAYVAKTSDADANVSVNLTNSELKDGKMTFKVYSDKATTADIIVAAKTSTGAVYATTLTYTFGEQDIPADTSVVMTLGSTEMLINNKVVDMKDAAPFAKNNRTYVPFRALGEALGAKVDYNKDAKTVTYTLGGTKIVMTLDSKTYTVNGAEKTMDVAPFAKDNRTYVPVRFVGEGLGFKVTGLQDGNGKYVAVAFTK